MSTRRNIFLIHSWDDAKTYAEAVDVLKARDVELADYSAPPWKGLRGSDAEIERRIRSRIRSQGRLQNGPHHTQEKEQ